MARILIIRFSAIGDVAMTIPVIYSVARRYPQHEFVVLSRDHLGSFFTNLPPNVKFFGVDLLQYAGWKGLNRLYRELKGMKFDFVADLHYVLRSRYLSLRFRCNGVRVVHLDKGRKEKKKLVRRKNKVMKPLNSSFERYTEVFEKLGMPVIPDFISVYGSDRGDLDSIVSLTGPKEENIWIGMAPFARHANKIYPLEYQEDIVVRLTQDPRVRIFLFGGGKEEQLVFEQWMEKYPRLVWYGRKLDMEQELILMSHLDVMFSMDSANMHLASLVATPVVSVWGATHPYAGFMGWGQSVKCAVQLELECRPCSVYGNKPCYRGDFACMSQLPVDKVIECIRFVISDR